MELCGKVKSLNLDVDRQRVELCETVKSQMSSVLAMALAYKMRMAVTPDNSRLVLQSLLPSGTVNAGTSFSEGFPDTFNMGVPVGGGLEAKSGDRRHSDGGSIVNPKDLKDNHTDHLLQIFSSTLQFPHIRDFGHSKLTPVSESDSEGEQRALFNNGGLRRRDSSPVLSLQSLAHQPGSLMHGFLRRRSSTSALYAVKESSESNSVDIPSQSSLSPCSTDTGVNPTEGLQQEVETLAPTVTNTSSTQANTDSLDSSSTKNKGFGILSRTRQFGAWLGKVTHGEKVEVSRKDLNVFAPSSF